MAMPTSRKSPTKKAPAAARSSKASSSAGLPEVGEPAPDIVAPMQDGELFRLADHRGKKVVLFFYPKADTPGCTKEACGFRDQWSRFHERNAIVVGVSPDSAAAQTKFQTKYSLPYPLIADADHKVAESYGVWGAKSMYGKTYMGVNRTTFLIDEEGRIARVWEKVKPEGHAGEVWAALE
jgi:thioredoxin-dependent peroxiredoxin